MLELAGTVRMMFARHPKAMVGVAVVEVCLWIALITYVGMGAVKAVRYVDSHGLRGVAARVWMGHS